MILEIAAIWAVYMAYALITQADPPLSVLMLLLILVDAATGRIRGWSAKRRRPG